MQSETKSHRKTRDRENYKNNHAPIQISMLHLILFSNASVVLLLFLSIRNTLCDISQDDDGLNALFIVSLQYLSHYTDTI